MSPHALRQRMRHGNVYPPERAQVALDRFFTEANLTRCATWRSALTARRVEGQLAGFVTNGSLGVMPRTSDRVLVVVDGSAAGSAAVRGRDLAGCSTPTWCRGPEGMPGTTSEEERATREVADDAADMGAEVVRVEGDDVAAAVAGLARARGATHVVIAHRPQTGSSAFAAPRSPTC